MELRIYRLPLMLQQSKSFPAVPDHDSSAWLTSLNHAKARWGDPTCARLKYHAPDKGPWNREIRSFAISVESDDLFKVQKHVGRIHHVHQKLSDSLKLVCKKKQKRLLHPYCIHIMPIFTIVYPFFLPILDSAAGGIDSLYWTACWSNSPHAAGGKDRKYLQAVRGGMLCTHW
jgi:hypothetical protein